jgi:hypothetical protein
MKSLLFIILFISFNASNAFCQSNEDYYLIKMTILSKISGEDLLKLNSEVIINTLEKTVEYTETIAVLEQDITYLFDYSGYSSTKDGVTTINFKYKDNPYGSYGKISFNVFNNLLQIIPPDFAGAYRRGGLYNFKMVSSLIKVPTKEELKKEEEEKQKLEMQKKEVDMKVTASINDFLEQGNIGEAAKEFSKLNNEDLELKRVIQNSLDANYSKDSLPTQLIAFKEIIQKNEEIISKLIVGTHNYRIEKNGNFFIDESKVSVLPMSLVEEKTFGKFNTKIASYGSFNLSVTEKMIYKSGITDIYDNSVRLVIPEDRKLNEIYEKKGQLYFGRFGAPRSAWYVGTYDRNIKEEAIKQSRDKNLVLNPIALDSSLKGKILIQPLFSISVKISSFDYNMSEKMSEIELKERKEYKTIKEVKPKKAVGRKIVKSIIYSSTCASLVYLYYALLK